MKKTAVIAILMAAAVFTATASAGGSYEPAADAESVPAIGGLAKLDCAAAILIERTTGTVLYEQEADVKRPPASVTKIMTLLIITEEIEAGRLKLEDTVTASTKASKMGGSQIYLREYEQMTVHELLKAIAVASANDASVAMAEHISGSEETFVEKMNTRARELGMKNTSFVNCCGLDADGHLTTARDIAIMSKQLLSHELIRNYSTIWTDSLRDGKWSLVNTNRLVRFYEGTTGLKTGSTDLAKNCISASAEKNGTELIAVILGAESGTIRFDEAKKLLNYGFANYELTLPDTALPADTVIPVKRGTSKTAAISISDSRGAVVPKGQAASIVRELILPESLEAPVETGQTAGEAVYTLDGRELCRIPIKVTDGVPRAGYFYYLGEIWRAVTG